MEPMTMGLIAAGAGAGLNALGGIIGGAQEGRAARQARDWYDRQTMGGNQLLGGSFYNNRDYVDLVNTSQLLAIARQHQDLPEMERLAGIMDEITGRMGGSIQGQQQALADTVSARQSGNLARHDTDTADLYGDENAALGAYDAGASSLMRLAQGEEGMAEAWGQGREAIIRDDYARALDSDLGQTTATLAASGFGNSTANAMARSEVARDNTRERSRALQDLGEASIDRRMGARRNVVATGRALHDTRAGLNQGRIMRRYARTADRGALEERNLGRDIALHGEPINTRLGIHQSSITNPWLNANTSQYYPGSSGMASALSSIGQTAGAVGFDIMGQQSQLQLLDRLHPRATVEP